MTESLINTVMNHWTEPKKPYAFVSLTFNRASEAMIFLDSLKVKSRSSLQFP